MNGGLLGTCRAASSTPNSKPSPSPSTPPCCPTWSRPNSATTWSYCEAIHRERLLSFAEARNTIREYLEQQQHSLCQKAWIATLRRPGMGATPPSA
jgi:hypothetical protein